MRSADKESINFFSSPPSVYDSYYRWLRLLHSLSFHITYPLVTESPCRGCDENPLRRVNPDLFSYGNSPVMSSIVTHLKPIYQHVPDCWPFDALFFWRSMTLRAMGWMYEPFTAVFWFSQFHVRSSSLLKNACGDTWEAQWKKFFQFGSSVYCMILGMLALEDCLNFIPLLFFSLDSPVFNYCLFTIIRIWMDIASEGLWENQAIWFEDHRVHCRFCILCSRS